MAAGSPAGRVGPRPRSGPHAGLLWQRWLGDGPCAEHPSAQSAASRQNLGACGGFPGGQGALSRPQGLDVASWGPSPTGAAWG